MNKNFTRIMKIQGLLLLLTGALMFGTCRKDKLKQANVKDRQAIMENNAQGCLCQDLLAKSAD